MMPSFGMEERGYSKAEVDNYIDMIRDEYQRALNINALLNIQLKNSGHCTGEQSQIILQYEFAKVLEINEVLSLELENSGRALSAGEQKRLREDLTKVLEINEILNAELENLIGFLKEPAYNAG